MLTQELPPAGTVKEMDCAWAPGAVNSMYMQILQIDLLMFARGYGSAWYITKRI
jgi:hypothetical protein